MLELICFLFYNACKLGPVRIRKKRFDNIYPARYVIDSRTAVDSFVVSLHFAKAKASNFSYSDTFDSFCKACGELPRYQRGVLMISTANFQTTLKLAKWLQLAEKLKFSMQISLLILSGIH